MFYFQFIVKFVVFFVDGDGFDFVNINEFDTDDANYTIRTNDCVEFAPTVENKRWCVAHTFALIAAYNKYRDQFVFAKKKKDVWELITDCLNSNGMNV